MTPIKLGSVYEPLIAVDWVTTTQLTSISIAGEVARPLDKRAALEFARGDGKQADRGQDRGVTKLGLGRNDAVGNVVVDSLHVVSACTPCFLQLKRGYPSYAVLLLLHLKLGTIFEGPLDDVGIVTSTLHPLTTFQGGPPVGEVLD